jgi:hypothetical protein
MKITIKIDALSQGLAPTGSTQPQLSLYNNHCIIAEKEGVGRGEQGRRSCKRKEREASERKLT